MGEYVLPKSNISQWLSKLLAKYAVYVPIEVEKQVHWHLLEPRDLEKEPDAITPAQRRIRASEPVKSFMFQPRRQVASFPEPFTPEVSKPRVLLGIKSCDIAALKVHDKILGEGEFKDPFYLAQRKNTLLVVADCPEPEQSCFCNLLGLTPYAMEAGDAVLSVVDGNWVLGVTESGKGLVDLASELFTELREGSSELARRDEQRHTALVTLNMTNTKPWNPDLAGAVAAKLSDTAFWNKHAETCVECFGCLMGCPTCYCFLLYDQARDAGVDRTRAWDACYEAAYARVGGGANPRAEFVKRFANRFSCKFSAFKTDHGMYACTGCGRCLKSCMGKIDIRKVLGEL
ncbi:4Fe-4S dicluster domain-containing protein [candidate division WOR-3 bacterium]|nr:4Fe-4S dicluster domain-containing protein [candidate division WOR-3 bacterium]